MKLQIVISAVHHRRRRNARLSR